MCRVCVLSYVVCVVCVCVCVRVRVQLDEACNKKAYPDGRRGFGCVLSASAVRALSVHTRPLFYEPHRTSGAGRSPCLQGISVVPCSIAPSAATRTRSSLCCSGNLSSLAGTQAAQAVLSSPRKCSSPSPFSLCPCSQGPAYSRRVESTFRGPSHGSYPSPGNRSRCRSHPRRVRTQSPESPKSHVGTRPHGYP